MQAIVALLMIFALILSVQAAVTEEEGVLVLNEENFDTVVGKFPCLFML